ncbi:MAG: hypothetical protein GX975_05445 [Clostridiales bacterium]|nr:hypothetical protein [Clostridiales bacterium]
MGLNSGQFTNTNSNFTSVVFTIEEDGWLEIIPISSTVTVYISGSSTAYEYNGEERTITGYAVSIDDSLYTESDFTFSGSASVSGTNAGTYPMGLDPGQFTNTNSNFSSVVFDVFDGRLAISPVSSQVTVTITENSASYEYNREERTLTGYSVSSNNPLYTESDFTFSGSASVSGTNAGTYDMNLSPGDFTNTSNNNFTNVVFEVVDGALTITPVSSTVTVNITGNSANCEYSGQAQSVSGYTSTISDPLNLYAESDFSFTGTGGIPIASGTDPGTYNMNLSSGNFTNSNVNFTNVSFVIVADGKLTITVAIPEQGSIYIQKLEFPAPSDPFYIDDDLSYTLVGNQYRVEYIYTDPVSGDITYVGFFSAGDIKFGKVGEMNEAGPYIEVLQMTEL